MARGSIGFDTGMAGCEGIMGGTMNGSAAYSTNYTRMGTGSSLRINPGSGASGWFSSTGGMYSFSSWGLYIATMPSVDRKILAGTSTQGAELVLASTGYLKYYYYNGVTRTYSGQGSHQLVTGQWYWINFRSSWSGAGTKVVGRVDDEDDYSTSNTTPGGGNAVIGCDGTEASAIDIYFDDMIFDSVAFAGNKTSRVALLLPVSDSNITNWVAGGGGTSSLFEGVNNVPPNGPQGPCADNAKSIKCNNTSGTASYSANLATPSTVGMGAGDTFLAFNGWCHTGEDISTGTKSGKIEMTTPVVAAQTFTFGGDGGQHGVSPTGWTRPFTLEASSGITSSTTPVMKVTKTDTGSRYACVDFMGGYVAWTPAVVVAAGGKPIRSISQAVQRASAY